MTTQTDNTTKFSTATHSDSAYKLLVESFLDFGYFLVTPDGQITTWNGGAQRLLQYTKEEVVGQPLSLLYTTESKARCAPAREQEEAQAKQVFEQQGWRVRKDGSLLWLQTQVKPVYTNGQELAGFAYILREVPEQQQPEPGLLKAFQELKESEERHRLLVEGVTDYAIFMLDPQGCVATWNEGARKIKGYTAEDIIGSYFGKFYSQDALDSGFPAYELREAIKRGRFEDEGWRYRKDGTAFWANVIITAIFNSRKELIGFSKITRDLTERRQLEEELRRKNEELRENEERMRLLVDSVKDYAILMLDPMGNIISWNTGAERIKGYKAHEIIGRHFSTFYNQEAIEKGFPEFELQKAQQQGRFEDEGWRLRKDGTSFWANVVISPVYNFKNELLGFAKITRNLTERRRNEELMEKNKELVRINNELDNFVYTASHDLKSPVVNLEGLLTALYEDLGEERRQHEQVLSKMESAIYTLKKVINDLADVSRVLQGKEKAERVSIQQLVNEIKDSLQQTIKQSRTTITVDTGAFEFLYYTRKNLRSILYNLISNAIKYADPQRDPEVHIGTQLSATGERVVSVADNGLGLDQKQVSKIFSLFKRAHDHVEGSGIGLYLVKRILDNSGDSIEVQSELGKGSVFTVYLRQE